MRAIRARATQPEVLIGELLEAEGYAVLRNLSSMPGSPDIILFRHRVAIFVHGCFWHGHECHLFKVPETRREFWLEKIGKNRRRDEASRHRLMKAGWRVFEVWECSLRGKFRKPHTQVLAELTDWILSGPLPAHAELASNSPA